MAEGGGEFGYRNPDLDNRIDHDDDGDGEHEVDTTRPFHPGSSSTPCQPGDIYHRGEKMGMSTFTKEKSGLPDSFYTETSFGGEETPLLGGFIHPDDKQSMLEKAKEKIRKLLPKVDFKKLGPIGFSKKGNQAEIVSFGPRRGESKIFKLDDEGLQKVSQTQKKQLWGQELKTSLLKTATPSENNAKD